MYNVKIEQSVIYLINTENKLLDSIKLSYVNDFGYLSNNKLYASNIDTVVLVGDNAKIPSINTSIEDTFGVKPNTDMNTSVVLFEELQKDTLK